MTLSIVPIVLCLGLFLSAGAATAAPRTVRLAVPGQTYVIASHVAKANGYYSHENLDVELVQMPVGIGVKALLAGNVEFAALGSGLFSAILGGAPLRIVMSSFRRPLFFLYTRPAIREISQLKEKKIAVPALGTSAHSMLADILRKRGQDPARDVAMIGLGLTSTLLQALTNNVVDAAVLSPPYSFIAEEAGFHELISLIDEDVIFPGGGIGTSQSLLHADPALVERFTRASLKGHLYARQNRSGTIPIIVRHMRMKEDYAAKYFELMRQATTVNGSIDLDEQRMALEPALRLRGDKHPPAVDKIFDFSGIQKIGKELRAQNWRP